MLDEQFTEEAQKIKDQLEKFQQEVGEIRIALAIEAAGNAGDVTEQIKLTEQQIREQAEIAKANFEKKPAILNLFTTDKEAAQKLVDDFGKNIDAATPGKIKEATEKISKEAATDFVDSLVDNFTKEIAGSSAKFTAIESELSSQLISLSQALEVVGGAGNLDQAKGLLSLLGFDTDTLLGDAETVKDASDRIKSEIQRTQNDLLSNQESFASSFISNTQKTISGIEAEIKRLEGIGLTPPETARLEELKKQYEELTKAIEEARAKTIGLQTETDKLSFDDAFAGATSGVKQLGADLATIFEGLGRSVDPGKLRIASEGVNALVGAFDALFSVQLNNAGLINKEEIADIDARIAKQQEAAANAVNLTEEQRKAQEKNLAQLNKTREKLLEEREAKEREIMLRQFRFNQAVQVAEAIVGTSVAVVNALKIAPPLGFILAGVIAAAGAVQVAKILATKPTFYKGSEFVTASPGKMGKDSIDAKVHHGERIVPTATNKRYFGDFNAITDGKIQPGSVEALSNMPQKLQQLIISNPSLFAKGGDDQFTRVIPVLHKRKREQIPMLTVNPDTMKTVEKFHQKQRVSAGGGVDIHQLASKMAEEMYKMQHKDSSVDRYQLDTMRDLSRKVDFLNKQITELKNKK